MKVDFASIPRNIFGQIDHPLPLLKTKDGTIVGPLARGHRLNMKLKFNELSEATFEYPARADGVDSPFYDRVVSDMLVQIDPYGVFVIKNIASSSNGIKESKECTLVSLEYELAGKQLYLGAGTYKFYDPVNPTDTILGRCMEMTRNWKIGSVSASLWGKYRTFDQVDTKLLDFMIDQIQQTYECVFVFDTYSRTFDVVDANNKTDMLPIYLSFHNLIKETKVNDNMDKFATRITVSGAEGVDIRSVNPTGTSQIINLDYWVENGSITGTTAAHYHDWKASIQTNQAYYRSLVALQSSASGRYLTEKAHLADLEGELTSLDNLRSVNLQGLNMATTEGSPTQEGTRQYFQARLNEIAVQYTAKQTEITAQKALMDKVKGEYDQAGKDIVAVNQKLAFNKFFTTDEINTLDHYLIDGDFADQTFAVFDVDITGDKDSFKNVGSASISLTDVTVVDIETSIANRRILTITGGRITITGSDYSLSSSLVRGTLDYKNGSDVVLSAYLGSGIVNKSSFPSGNLSCVCKSSFNVDTLLNGMEKTVVKTTDKDTGVTYSDVSYHGSGSIRTTDNAFYFTRNVTEYQKYSVAQDLYDHAEKCMEEIAYPIYEFELSSGNIIWAKEFEPFKNALKLGCGVYLQLNDSTLLHPLLLEVHIDYERPDNFNMIFSSEFQLKRPDSVNRMRSILKDTQSSSRTFDAERLKYNSGHLSGAAEALDTFWKNGINAAYQQVTAGTEQSVQINGGGIKVGTAGSSEYIVLADGMIALVDDRTKTAKMAMGHFYDPKTGINHYGIAAPVIYGQLLLGNGLSVACPDINGGGMLFEADGKGVRLHNSRFSLSHDRGGQVILDPTIGIAIGKDGMYEFDDNGMVVFNQDKANLYIDMDGNLNVKGKGAFDGDVIVNNLFFRDGTDVKTLLSKSTNKISSGLLDLGNIQLDGPAGDISMTGDIDMDGSINLGGNITMGGTLNLSALSSINFGSNAFVKTKYSTNKNATIPSGWSDTWNSSWSASTSTEVWAINSYDGGVKWVGPVLMQGKNGQNGLNGANGADGSDANVDYANILSALQKAASTKTTFITADEMGAPSIYGGKIYGAEMYANEFNVFPLDDTSVGGSFNLFGNFNSSIYHFLEIDYSIDAFGTPRINFDSPSRGNAIFDFPITSFLGHVDFGRASVNWGKNAPVAVFGGD